LALELRRTVGGADKISIFLRICQQIYRKWYFTGEKTGKNVKKHKN
jgi:hypothetical protein